MILTLLIVMPLVGALAVLATPRDDSGLQKGVALGASLVTFLASLPLFFAFQTYTPDFQFTMDRAWLADLGLRYQVGLDGLSLFLVLLTTFLVPVVLLASWNAIEERVKLFLIAMLVMESATIGAFVTTNLFFFYMFWEATLIPLYLMIGVFGSGNKIRSANKFFLFTLAGSLLMLAGIVYLGLEHTRQLGYPSLYVNDLMRLKLNGEQQNWLFLAFMLAFAIKVPMFPVHTWLPDAHTDAPTAGSVMLAGVMLKLGTYGVLRFALPLFPAAAAQYAEFFSWLAAIGIVYGALVAWIQPDIKRLIAYSSVSHLGFVMLGIFSGTLEGASGAVLQMINHGISTGALFLCVGVLYERRHTRLLDEYGGLARRMPIFAFVFMVSMLSSVGLPGLNGFAGEFPILAGAFVRAATLADVTGDTTGFIITTMAVSGVIFGAMYLLWMYRRTMFGPLDVARNGYLTDMSVREIVVFVPLLAAMFWIGLAPDGLYRRITPTVNVILERAHQSKPVTQGWPGNRAELVVPPEALP